MKTRVKLTKIIRMGQVKIVMQIKFRRIIVTNSADRYIPPSTIAGAKTFMLSQRIGFEMLQLLLYSKRTKKLAVVKKHHCFIIIITLYQSIIVK